MPIHTIIKNGRRMYQWGRSGKVYPTRQQAEEQARAAYASGYREKDTHRKK